MPLLALPRRLSLAIGPRRKGDLPALAVRVGAETGRHRPPFSHSPTPCPRGSTENSCRRSEAAVPFPAWYSNREPAVKGVGSRRWDGGEDDAPDGGRAARSSKAEPPVERRCGPCAGEGDRNRTSYHINRAVLGGPTNTFELEYPSRRAIALPPPGAGRRKASPLRRL